VNDEEVFAYLDGLRGDEPTCVVNAFVEAARELVQVTRRIAELEEQIAAERQRQIALRAGPVG